jgi:hypothetical protein
MVGDDVILTGGPCALQTGAQAYNLVKNIEGVNKITNNIEVLPDGQL